MEQNINMLRYPRTEHLEDSRLGPGDDAKGRVKLTALAGCWIVVEEKVDGANAGLSFVDGQLMLQSRGHYLAGGGRERQFNRFKAWADCHEEALFKALGERYVMYGEWMGAKHTLSYNKLPHLFMEFDVYDREAGLFLNTASRQKLLAHTPVVSVPVLWEGYAPSRMKDIMAMVGNSLCRDENWRTDLAEASKRAGVDPVQALAECDVSDLIEGIYIKVETAAGTVDRYKWVRKGFVQAIEASGSHWAERPLIANGLSNEVDLFSPSIVWETPGILGRDGWGAFKAWAQTPPEAAGLPQIQAKRAKP